MLSFSRSYAEGKRSTPSAAQRGDQLFPNAPSGTASTPYGFTGEMQGVGGLYLRARYYDSHIARFTTQDPWQGDPTRPGTLNAYTYVLNNPVRFTDPSGNCPFDFNRDGECDPQEIKAGLMLGVLVMLDTQSQKAFRADFAAGFASEAILDVGGFDPRVVEAVKANSCESDAMYTGRITADVLSIIGGVGGFAAGGTTTVGGFALCGSGVLCLVGVAVSAGGLVATGYSGSVVVAGIGNFQQNLSHFSSKPVYNPSLGYFGSNTGINRSNVRQLRQNMGIKGRTPGQEAHHIVPGTSKYPSATEARKILNRFVIDINSADNGVLIPKNIHRHLNSHKYQDAILRELSLANTQDEVIMILQDIGAKLLTNMFP